MSPDLILVISVVGAVLLVVILFNWIDGKFDKKTKWYKLNNKVIRKYLEVPGINPCTKCGCEKCDLIVDLNIPEIAIDKNKEVLFSSYFWPLFYIQCQKCGTRSKEDDDLSSVINAWNMDSRFQLEDNK